MQDFQTSFTQGFILDRLDSKQCGCLLLGVAGHTALPTSQFPLYRK
jgi:hypothetical protein